MIKNYDYDVVVVGGGHAGSEAAHAAATMGMKTMMYVFNKKMIANMPCNPSIGGSAKGIVVREIDALGGIMGKFADKHYLQMKVLNMSKGPGVQSLRAQEDKMTYPNSIWHYLETVENLSIEEKEVVDIENLSEGEETLFRIGFAGTDEKVLTRAVILCTGTHLESTILRGHHVEVGGPDGEKPSHGLSASLERLGLSLFRLKTGTPPRIEKSSIDFSKLEPQYGSDGHFAFSYDTDDFVPLDEQCVCYITYTTPKTHEIIREHLKDSAMYGGVVTGVGPRYCPSIEDKIVRFADKPRHLLFLEPESKYNDSIYLQGFSTSMPIDVQEEMVHSLPGLEHAKIMKYAYAIEYNAIRPLEFSASLMSYKVKGLFAAGQVIGTSGYEEAGALGLMAAINCVRFLRNEEPFILRRDEAYIGVMIDDLVTKGTEEPYRLLSARSEYRLITRSDNADIRLMKYGYELGLNSKERYQKLNLKLDHLKKAVEVLKSYHVKKDQRVIDYVVSLGFEIPNESVSFYDLLKRQKVEYSVLNTFQPLFPLTDNERICLEIELKYEGYIKMAYQQAEKLKQMEDFKIPSDIDFSKIDGISLEAREKLNKIRPTTIGLASRITSVHPADIDTLIFYIKNMKRGNKHD